MKTYIELSRKCDGAVELRMDVTNMTPSNQKSCYDGLYNQMDRDEFEIFIYESEKSLEEI